MPEITAVNKVVLELMHLPGRKRPILAVRREPGRYDILAYFRSEAACDEFEAMVKKGIRWQAAEDSEP